MKLQRLAGVVALCLVANSVITASAKVTEIKGAGLGVSVDDATGQYTVHRDQPKQDWTGSIGQAVQVVASGAANDGGGVYNFIKLNLPANITGEIDAYTDRPVVVFKYTCADAMAKPPADFPAFAAIPSDLHVVSFTNKEFAAPSFRTAQQGGGPWILFDDNADTTVISPNANFMIADLHGDGVKNVSSGFVAPLANLPAGFTHRTMLVFGHGIGNTINAWGDSFLKSIGAHRPANDADTGLKYLGYWTDNGADYYYHFDPDKGYTGTLLAVSDQLKKLGITIGYMQLDSWWYQKTSTGADGKPGKAKKVEALPESSWNKYGGLWEYTAHKDLFPDGLDAFQKKLGLPLITHNRWVDVASPYRQKYKISGVGAIDPKWWDDIADYLKHNGVMTYEQDWLNEIYNHSPEFQSTVGVADLFMDNMARACRERGMTMQYCMGLPRDYLQGAKYGNLTTVRVCTDRFSRKRWNDALYVSQLAGALGEWPWVDVFKSRETPNLILATMSAGMVGIGDALDKFDVDNLKKVERPDGLLVKPDHPMVPLDSIYLADATKQSTPMIAATTSRQGDGVTAYVFAYTRKPNQSTLQFKLSDLGITGDAYVYDAIDQSAKRVTAGGEFTDHFGTAATTQPDDQPWKFYVVAPVTRCGIALIGDAGKFASMGRQRISDQAISDQEMKVTVEFAVGEGAVTLQGFALASPQATAGQGSVQNLNYDSKSNRFQFQVAPPVGETRATVNIHR